MLGIDPREVSAYMELSFFGGGWGAREVYEGWSDSLEILSVGDLPLL